MHVTPSDSPDQHRTLIEQLRLLMTTTKSTVITAILQVLVLLWILSNPLNALGLKVWAVSAIAIRLMCAWNAKVTLKHIDDHPNPLHILRRSFVLYSFDAAVWGALVWCSLKGASAGGMVFAITTVAAIVAGSRTTLAAVLPICISYCLISSFLLAAKLIQMPDPTLRALSIASLLYLITLLGQARNINQSILESIRLRFEKLDLVGQLEVEMQQARDANMAKTKFLAAVGHDLRQPIHAQGLFLHVLSNSPLTDFQKSILEKTNNAMQVTTEMLDTLLDFSKLEAGVITPKVTNFHLQDIFHQIENELGVMADAKSLIYRSRETTLGVKTDASMLTLILRNLTSNAIRYTSHGGVLIACRRRGEHAVVEVWDTGIGIPSSKYEEIFLEFHQLDNAERNRDEGLGLGLAIARGYAKTLSHELTVSSRLGRGSVFRLKLPIASTVDSAKQLPIEDTNIHLDLDVLLIEDDVLVVDAMQALLQNWRCKLHVVNNLAEAIELVAVHCPQLIISDYRLSDVMTGADVIANIRQIVQQPDLPAIIITGDTAPERIREAIGSGVLLLHKPVNSKQLHQAILEAISDLKTV